MNETSYKRNQVEVFKTNVNDRRQAAGIVGMIHKSFAGYQATFDLDDCDNILRVQSYNAPVKSTLLISLLKKAGCYAEVLPDTVPAPRMPTHMGLVNQASTV